MQRIFSRPEGNLVDVLSGLFPSLSHDMIVNIISPLMLGVYFFSLILFAIYSRFSKSKRSLSLKKALLYGLFVWFLLGFFIRVLVFIFPAGIPGAQKFALGFMMWAAFLGGALATRKRSHISLNVLKSQISKKNIHFVNLLSNLLASSCCLYFAFLGFMQVNFEYVDWISAPGVGVFEALPIPLWVVTIAIPISLLLIAMRFLANGILDFILKKSVVQGSEYHGE